MTKRSHVNFVQTERIAGAYPGTVQVDTLRAKHRLRVTVAIALTPLGGKKLTKTAKATVSL